MTPTRFSKSIPIKGTNHTATIELEKSHNPSTNQETINLTITIEKIKYQFNGTINQITQILPTIIKTMIIGDSSILFEYLASDDYNITFANDYTTLSILIPLTVGKQSHSIIMECHTDTIDILYNLALMRIDELTTKLGIVQLDSELKEQQIETLKDEKKRMVSLIDELNDKYDELGQVLEKRNDELDEELGDMIIARGQQDGKIETLENENKRLELVIDELNGKYNGLRGMVRKMDDSMYDYSGIPKIEAKLLPFFNKNVPGEFVFFVRKFTGNNGIRGITNLNNEYASYEDNIYITNYGKVYLASVTNPGYRQVTNIMCREFEFFIPVNYIKLLLILYDVKSQYVHNGITIMGGGDNDGGQLVRNIFKYIESIKKMVKDQGISNI